MPLRVSNLGYVAVRKESSKGTPADVPNVYLPAYSESLMTAVNLNEDSPIWGSKVARRRLLQGQRGHGGDLQVLAEPNTLGYLLDMLLYKDSSSGGDPYTHTFIPGTNNPNAYTVDISKGGMVFRFMGVEASEMGFERDDNKMLANLTVAGLKSFIMREVDNVASNVVTLKTDYDPSPTDGLVDGDTISLLDVSAGTTEDFTVSSIDSNGTDVTLSGAPASIQAGDILFIKPQTSPSFSTIDPLLWARTEFRLENTAADALTATHTPMDEASFSITHGFTNDAGEMRSGSFDPAELGRALVDFTLSATKFFDTPTSLNEYLATSKKALVIRMFSGSSYELRITANSIKANEHPANLATGDPVLAELEYMTEYNDSDGQFLKVELLNAVSTI